MNISKLSDLIWANSVEIPFGNTAAWDEDTFLKNWFEENKLLELYDGGSPGWYWFICNISYKKIRVLPKPYELVWRQLSCPVGDNYDGRLGGLTFFASQLVLAVVVVGSFPPLTR